MNHKFFRKFFFLAKQSKHVRSSHRSDLKLKIIHGRFTKISSTLSKEISKSVVFFGQIPENLTKYRLNSSDSILISIVITLHLSLTIGGSKMIFSSHDCDHAWSITKPSRLSKISQSWMHKTIDRFFTMMHCYHL